MVCVVVVVVHVGRLRHDCCARHGRGGAPSLFGVYAAL